ncbi:MAG: cupredoxin domain-containing protein [Bdellovibrionales bacterium]
MNTRITTRGKAFTSGLTIAFILSVLSASASAPVAHAEWKVDFSRRFKESRSDDLRAPASQGELPVESPQPGFLESLFLSGEISQEIVILNTEKGFVPSTLRVKKGLNYQIHVVNVNEGNKNVSFVLDSFSEHHATYFGKIKSFVIRPVKEGVYRFVSPETAASGKLVVYPGGPENRLPASE